MPTPAFLAIALSDVLPEAASASLAAARIRSRLLTASLRVGFWGVEFTSVKCSVPGPAAPQVVKRRGLRYGKSRIGGVSAYCGTP